MASYRIAQKSIRKLTLPKGYEKETIQIGIPAGDEETNVLNLQNVGDMVLPSARFGSACEKNAHGYCYPDKTQPMVRRYVTTIWTQPYGNDYASPVASDIYRKCYPVVEVAPTEIELELFQDQNNIRYIIANLTDEIRENYMVQAVNLFLEIFGECYVYSDEFSMATPNNRRRCNWQMLPPGQKPSVHLSNMLRDAGENADSYDVERLRVLDRYDAEQVVEGINGFEGYYAYVFENHCVLESAIYGNATYIIPKDNWEELSQKTKQELLDEDVVIAKLIHNERWKYAIRSKMSELEDQ